MSDKEFPYTITLPSGRVIPSAVNPATGEGMVKVNYPEGWRLEDHSCPFPKPE